MMIYIYKLRTDNNGAPCIFDNTLSLALCKPGYRKKAEEEDWILGFKGRTYDPDEPLVYVARITRKETVHDYHITNKYSSRPDRVYELGPSGRYVVRANALYHNDGMNIRKDLGENGDAHVLLSDDFRYFGVNSYKVSKAQYPHLKAFVHKMTQTKYPTKVPADVEKECQSLIEDLWAEFQGVVHGGPTEQPAATAKSCAKGNANPCRKRQCSVCGSANRNSRQTGVAADPLSSGEGLRNATVRKRRAC